MHTCTHTYSPCCRGAMRSRSAVRSDDSVRFGTCCGHRGYGCIMLRGHDISTKVCICVYTYLGAYVLVCVCVFVCVHISQDWCMLWPPRIWMLYAVGLRHQYECVYMYIHVYISIHIYIYIYILSV